MGKNILHSKLNEEYKDLKKKITSALYMLKDAKKNEWDEWSQYDKEAFYRIKSSDIRTKKEILKIMHKQAKEMKMLIWSANSLYRRSKQN